MIKLKLTKLDARHTGWRYFSHLVDYTPWHKVQFHQHRKWCIDTLGLSKELPDWLEDAKTKTVNLQSPILSWAWHFDLSMSQRRLYFCDEKTAMLFTLACL